MGSMCVSSCRCCVFVSVMGIIVILFVIYSSMYKYYVTHCNCISFL